MWTTPSTELFFIEVPPPTPDKLFVLLLATHTCRRRRAPGTPSVKTLVFQVFRDSRVPQDEVHIDVPRLRPLTYRSYTHSLRECFAELSRDRPSPLELQSQP